MCIEVTTYQPIAASKRKQEPETIITSEPLLFLHRRKSCVP